MANKALVRFRKQFHDLKAEIEKIEAQVNPLREARDKIMEQIRPLEAKAEDLASKFRKIEADNNLFDKMNELAALARACGNKVGIREEDGTIWHPEDADEDIPEHLREKAKANRENKAAFLKKVAAEAESG